MVPHGLMRTSRIPGANRAVFDGSDFSVAEPGGDRSGVKAEKVAPLDVRDAAFGDQPSNVSDRNVEVRSDGCDVDQPRHSSLGRWRMGWRTTWFDGRRSRRSRIARHDPTSPEASSHPSNRNGVGACVSNSLGELSRSSG